MTAGSWPALAGAANRIIAARLRRPLGRAPTWRRPMRRLSSSATTTTPPAPSWAHAHRSREVLVASRTRVTPDLADDLRGAGFAVVDGDDVAAADRPARRDRRAGVWLLTSGSTGRPKRVAHTLASLTTVAGDQPRRTWLCPYAHGAYAWWQVVTLSIAHPGQDVLVHRARRARHLAGPGPRGRRDRGLRHPDVLAPGPLPRPRERRRAAARAGDPRRRAGRPGDPDPLHRDLPAARVSWIYASSEAGATIAVHDGRAGFPRGVARARDCDGPARP